MASVLVRHFWSRPRQVPESSVDRSATNLEEFQANVESSMVDKRGLQSLLSMDDMRVGRGASGVTSREQGKAYDSKRQGPGGLLHLARSSSQSTFMSTAGES